MIGGKIMGTLTHNPQAATMTMGRAMETHVIPYSLNNGNGYYKALPDEVFNFTKKYLPEGMHDGVHLRTNEKWITYQMMPGKNLVDIGAPPARVPNPAPGAYYGMELDQVRGYGNYGQDIKAATTIAQIP